jgi:hypothetical protein
MGLLAGIIVSRGFVSQDPASAGSLPLGTGKFTLIPIR